MINSHEPDIDKQIEEARELLSPYLDNEISLTEQAFVERILSEAPELQRELHNLRQTVALLQELPKIPSPRPFTLTETDAGLRPKKSLQGFWLTLFRPMWAGLVALIALVMIGGVFWRIATQETISMVVMVPNEESVQQESIATDESLASEESAEKPIAKSRAEELADDRPEVETMADDGAGTEGESMADDEEQIEANIVPHALPMMTPTAMGTVVNTETADTDILSGEQAESPPNINRSQALMVDESEESEPDQVTDVEADVAEGQTAPSQTNLMALATATTTPSSTGTPSPTDTSIPTSTFVPTSAFKPAPPTTKPTALPSPTSMTIAEAVLTPMPSLTSTSQPEDPQSLLPPTEERFTLRWIPIIILLVTVILFSFVFYLVWRKKPSQQE